MGEPKTSRDYWGKVKQRLSKLTSNSKSYTTDAAGPCFTSIPRNIVYVQPCSETEERRRSSVVSYCDFWYNCEQSKQDQFGSIFFNEHFINETNCVKVASDRDGDCLFTSTAYFLKQQYQDNELSADFLQQLTKKKVLLYEDISDIAYKLRQLTVQEWLANEEKYRAFLPEHTSEEYVCSAYWFSVKGTHRGLLEDTAPLALSNALLVTIRILLSDFSGSYRVLPFDVVYSLPVVYLMLNPDGNGHYDAMLLKKPKLDFALPAYTTSMFAMPSVVHP